MMNRRSFVSFGAAMLTRTIWGNEVNWLQAAAATSRIVKYDARGHRTGVKHVDKVRKTDAEWRQQLTPEQYEVTRRKGTERAFTGKFHANHADGIYRCVCCG